MSWKFAPIFAENAHLHLCFLSYGICAVANISSVMILGGKEGEQEYNGSRNSECSQLESEVIFCMTMDFVFNSNFNSMNWPQAERAAWQIIPEGRHQPSRAITSTFLLLLMKAMLAKIMRLIVAWVEEYTFTFTFHTGGKKMRKVW